VVTKMPRFPFDKFTDADTSLSTQMKATGEVMSVGRTMEESLLKGIRSLETGVFHLHQARFDAATTEEMLSYIEAGRDDRIYAIAELLRRGVEEEKIGKITQIDPLYLNAFSNIIAMERRLKKEEHDGLHLLEAKRMGFSDREIALLWETTPYEIFLMRKREGIFPSYKMIDSCASEFASYIPYFYSTYEGENESICDEREKIIVLGSGPIRIGQGVEFDYSTVHAITTIRELGYQAIIINNNPETVSTDYTTSDKLYFEPLCIEDVMNIIEHEKPRGVIVTLGGQTAVNLAKPLEDYGAPIIGTGCEAIERAENRDAFERVLLEERIPQPKGEAVTSIEDGIEAARRIGYPVLVRPSFVLGGRAMQIVSKEEELKNYLKTAVEIDASKPVLVDHYICGKEVEIDAVCDGTDVFVPGIMELVERTGVHSGDSISVYPPYSLSEEVRQKILKDADALGRAIGIVGLFNIQFIVDENDEVYIIEVNPRSSRTVPFLSKATGWPLADIATKVMLGISLKEQRVFSTHPDKKKRWYVKVPAFSFSKLKGMDSYLSPEMKSTGEAIGYDEKLHRAMYKALIASGIRLQNYGTVMVTLADEDKEEALPLVRRFYDLGFNIEATVGSAMFLKEHGIRTRIRRKLSEGSDEILQSIRAGYVSYVINTRAIRSGVHYEDGVAIRQCARENNITMFTSLDTVRVLLDVLEELTICVSTLDP
ncbi:MAG: carbamoyl-phosphate synthase large subunit, partial [Lachnospiraceae bacterium]|nr:carbamoyl-phosphate synthase large subunit [Lachnospiraceae bacterium]